MPIKFGWKPRTTFRALDDTPEAYNEGAVKVKDDLSGVEFGPGAAAFRSGTITTDGDGVFRLAFNTPFADANYQISLSCESSTGAVIATWATKAASGFYIRTYDADGEAKGNAVVDWLAMPL